VRPSSLIGRGHVPPSGQPHRKCAAAPGPRWPLDGAGVELDERLATPAQDRDRLPAIERLLSLLKK